MIKRLWLILLLAIPLGAQTVTYTPNLHLAQPPHGYPNWDAIINQNWSIIDQNVGAHQPWTLTTTGSCTPATYLNGNLNIPPCTGGGGGGSGSVGPAGVYNTPYFDTTTTIKGALMSIPLTAFGSSTTCNGAGDDSAAFTAAFSYSYAVNGTVAIEIPGGVCHLQSTVEYHGESFFGQGKKATFIVGPTASTLYRAPDRADSPTKQCCIEFSTVHDLTLLVDVTNDANTFSSTGAQAAWAAQGQGAGQGSVFANTFAGWTGQTVMGSVVSGATTIPLTNALTLTDYHSGVATDGWVKVGSEFMRYHGITNTSCPNSAPSCLLNVTRGITLAGVASTAASISGGTAITPVNPLAPTNVTDWIPAYTIGACAFAIPARDGTHLNGIPWQHGLLYNVDIEAITPAANPSGSACGVFIQGSFYAGGIRDYSQRSLTYGIIQAPPFTNTDAWLSGSASSDEMYFDHIFINATIPFLFVEGGLTQANAFNLHPTSGTNLEARGFTLYQIPCHSGAGGCQTSEMSEWFVSDLYEEWFDGGGAITTYPPMAQIGGYSHSFTGGFMNAPGGVGPTIWDASDSVVSNVVLGGVQINGNHNTILTDQGSTVANLTNNGLANNVSIPITQYSNRPANLTLTRTPWNKLCKDFLQKGAVNSDWFQCEDDLFYTPEDLINTSPIGTTATAVVNDSTVPITGRYLTIASPGTVSSIPLDGNAGGAMAIGQRFPKGTGWAYVAVYSPINTTQVVSLNCASGSAGSGTITYTANTWQIFKFRYDSTVGGCVVGANGGYFNFAAAGTATTIRLAFEGIVPDFDTLTVSGVLNQALSTPASSSAACIAGDWAHDATYVYTCTATNAWKRVAMATW